MAFRQQELVATFFKAADFGVKRRQQVAYLHGPAGGATGIVSARAGRLVEVFQACTQITTSGAATYTAEQLLGGMISRSPNGANRTDALPTAALLQTAFPEVQVNDTLRFYVYNSAGSGAYTVTVQAGASGTLVGSGVIGTGMIKEFLLRFTAIGTTPTYTCYQIEQNIGSGAYSGDLSVSGALTVGTTLGVAGATDLSDDATLATTKKLQFRDTGLFIHSSADGKLLISSDGVGTDDITLGGTVSISDDVLLATDKKVGFRDAGLYIQSGADGKLTIAADGSGADDITLSGTVTVSDDLTMAAAKGVVFGTSKLISEEIAISAADLVDVAAGKLGHANGQILVAAPGSGKVLSFISAVMSYTYGVAAYTGGGNLTVNIGGGGAALTGLISAANSLGAAASNITQFKALSVAAATLTVNTGLNLVSSGAFTQPGTATGTVKVFVTYMVHTL